MHPIQQQPTPPPSPSPHDSAVWHTVKINSLIDNGRFRETPDILTPFPPLPDERVFAEGQFRMLSFESAGDGSYHHQSGFIFGTGNLGLAMAGGFALAQAAGNSRRRHEAQLLAQRQWREIDSGRLWVTNRGVYLSTPQQLFALDYNEFQSMEMVAPRQARFSGVAANGPVTWILESDWAELVFTLWARILHPRHPQYITRGWIPPGWQNRVAAAGLPEPS